MAKIVYASLKKDKSTADRRSRKNRVAAKTVTAPDGSRQTLATVDADSPTFSDDLTTVFQRNVARARRDNRRLIGTTSDGKV